MMVLLLAEAWGDSLTADESFYIRAGTCALTTRIGDLEPSSPIGFKLLAGASTVLLGSGTGRPCGTTVSYASADIAAFYPADAPSLRWLILVARWPVILMSLLLAAIVFFWARGLNGNLAGLFALAIVAIEPSVLGHGHLVTPDLPVTLGVTGCLAAYWRWTGTRRRRWLVASGLALGLAMLARVSALELLPLLLVIGLAVEAGTFTMRLRRVVGAVGLVLLAAWALVCIAYLPFRYLLPGTSWPPPLSWVIPPAWVYELRFQLQHVRLGHPTYLNGQAYAAHAPWYYFFETIGLKTTIGLLVLIVIAAIVAARRRNRSELFFLWLPAALVVLIPTTGGLDLGIRYVLPIFPLLAVAAGSLLNVDLPRLGLRLAVVSVLVLASAGSSLVHAPLHLGYFNEVAGQTPERFLSDSNLDWGQDLWRLDEWWTARGRPPMSLAIFNLLPASSYGIQGPDVQPSRAPVVGLLAASLTRITISGDAYPDVRVAPYARLERTVPFARVGSSILIFQMNGELASATSRRPVSP
jgi:Dolichyl-phosphate-mannose-protein mannosyltransferase